jgi:hypothetical protein
MLDGNEIRADKGDVVDLAEGANNTRVVNSRDKDSQEVSQEGRLFLEVECQSFIVTTADIIKCVSSTGSNLHLNVGGPYNNILELVVFPCIRRAFYHRQSCIVLQTLFSRRWCHSKEKVLTNSSYLMYKKTSSGQRCARSVALITYTPYVRITHLSEIIRLELTFGILIRATKSLRCSITEKKSITTLG